MAVKVTRQGCKVETTYIIQPNGTYTERIVLSVDPASELSLVVERPAKRSARGPKAPLGSARKWFRS